MINKKNELWIGLLLGLCVPVIGAAVTMTIFEQLENSGIMKALSPTRVRTIYAIGILFNLIPFQYFKYKRYYEAMRGVLILTIFAVLAWAIYFFIL
jgi:Mg/Co/Ni transporter MgtE